MHPASHYIQVLLHFIISNIGARALSFVPENAIIHDMASIEMHWIHLTIYQKVLLLALSVSLQAMGWDDAYTPKQIHSI